jgi:hypothetical protein
MRQCCDGHSLPCLAPAIVPQSFWLSRRGTVTASVTQFGAVALSEDPTESELKRFQQRKGHLQEEIHVLDREIDTLKPQRKNTPHLIPVNSLPEEERLTRLRTERKHFIDTIKMIAYRAEWGARHKSEGSTSFFF